MSETYKIELTGPELKVLRFALGRMAHDEVRGMIDKIEAQVNAIEDQRAETALEG